MSCIFTNLFHILLILNEIEIDISIKSPELYSSSIIGSEFENSKSINEYSNQILILKLKSNESIFFGQQSNKSIYYLYMYIPNIWDFYTYLTSYFLFIFLFYHITLFKEVYECTPIIYVI